MSRDILTYLWMSLPWLFMAYPMSCSAKSTAPLDAKCSTFEVLDLLGSGLMETRSVVKLYYRKEQLGLSLRFAELE